MEVLDLLLISSNDNSKKLAWVLSVLTFRLLSRQTLPTMLCLPCR